MRVNVIGEYGADFAFFGIGLSYGITSKIRLNNALDFSLIDAGIKNKLFSVAKRLSHIGNAENKFLRQISVVIDITASLKWWKEMDTYKVATTAQSESTMHTILKTPITQECFERPILQKTLEHLEELRKQNDFDALTNELPCGWLQRRIWSANYAVLQNIYNQRKNHKLKEWRYFLKQVLLQIEYPEFIVKGGENEKAGNY